MGTFTYDSKLVATFDDRVLAHLQAVVWSKFRRGEYFAFTWTEGSAGGGSFGRTSVWMSPSVPVAFEFFGGRAPRLNPAWVTALSRSANSAGGLTVVPEPPGGEVREP